MFEPVTYMQNLHSKLRLTKDAYTFARVSGINALEEVLNDRRSTKFFAVDDSQDGQTIQRGGAFFERRIYTVFILTRTTYDDMDARAIAIAEAQTIYRSLLSSLIKDRYNIPLIDLSAIRFYEVPPAFADGTSGLYFMFTVENPVNLAYNADDWNS